MGVAGGAVGGVGEVGRGVAGQAGRLRWYVVARPGLSVVDVGRWRGGRRSGTGRWCRRRAGGAGWRGWGRWWRGSAAEWLVEGVAAGGAGWCSCFRGRGGSGRGWGGAAGVLPVFAERGAGCGEALAGLVARGRVEGLPGAPSLERLDVVQPALFTVMVALAGVWRCLGWSRAVAGHSQGEIAAACVAGILSLEDAARVVAVRSRVLADSLSGRGGMLSVAL